MMTSVSLQRGFIVSPNVFYCTSNPFPPILILNGGRHQKQRPLYDCEKSFNELYLESILSSLLAISGF